MSALLWVLAVVAYVVLTLLFAAVVRRVIGIHVSYVRSAVATVLALLLSRPLLDAFIREPDVEPDPGMQITMDIWLYVSLLGAFTFVLAMVLIVVAEVLVPDGSVPGPVDLVRSWRARMARSDRYVDIMRIATRHGLGRFLRGRKHLAGTMSERRDLARSVRRALEDGGVTFVKLGQQLSTRHDVLPEEFTTELAHLQDDAPPIAWEAVREVVRAELGEDPERVFAHIDREPLAAASIAQVHAARLTDGRNVVVKVQRPGIRTTVDRDLDIVDRLSSTLSARTDWGRSIGLAELSEGFASALLEELDFTIERDNMLGVAAALEENDGEPGITLPRPVPELSTSRVLVMDRLDGVALGSPGSALERFSPEHRREMASTLLDTVLDQLLESGIFHVDLHPGNILVADDGTLGMLDLGSVGRLGAKTRQAMGQFLAAIGNGDSVAATDALLELVDQPEHVDERALEQAIGVLILRFTAGGSVDGAAAFTSLFTLINDFRLGVPPEVAAVFRAMSTLEGTLRTIDPSYDLITEAKEMGRARMSGAAGVARIKEAAEQDLTTLIPLLRRLPRRVDRIADALEHGRITANVRLFADHRDRRIVTNLVNRTLLTVLAATTGLMAVGLYTIEEGPMVTAQASLYTVLATFLFVVSVVLGLRVLAIILKRESP